MLAVLVFHVFEITGRVGFGVLGRSAEVLGYLGPILFFVISGFLLYRPYVAARADGRQAPRTARYARRRVLRIVPAYWTVLTILAIFPGIIGVFSGDWWRYYGYLQLYSHRTISGGIPVAWTLGVEVTFYLMLPLWAWAIRKLAESQPRLGDPGRFNSTLTTELVPICLVALAGVGVQLAGAHEDVSDLLASSIAGQCCWLLLGMALAVVSATEASAPRNWGRLSAAARPWYRAALALGAFAGLALLVPRGGVLGLIALARNGQPVSTALGRIALTALLMLLVVTPALSPGGHRPTASSGRAWTRVLSARPMLWLGVISYSFYLWHLTVVQVIAYSNHPSAFSARGLGLLDNLHTARTPVLLIVSFAATAALASASYRFIELPFLRRKEG